MSFIILSLFLLLSPGVQTNPNQAPVTPYITAFTFCQDLPQGEYCDPAFPRSFVSCPNALTRYCPPRTLCSIGSSLGRIQCVPNLWDPVGQLCYGKADGTSFCLNNQTVVECENGESFSCPADMACKRRGRRAYCVQPQFLRQEPTTGLCNGLKGEGTVCHPTNLKKIIECPHESVSYCGIGHMCGLTGSDASKASCIPFEKDLDRFCSNKPLYSSRCVPGTKGTLILCSQIPQLLDCPTRKCVQELSITARCV